MSAGENTGSGDRFLEIPAAQKDARRQTEAVLREVLAERAHQWMEWGWSRGDADTDLVGHHHDDGHAEGDWTRFVVRFLGRSEQAIEDGDRVAWRSNMLSVAALAVAAIESHDRRLTHKAPGGFCEEETAA